MYEAEKQFRDFGVSWVTIIETTNMDKIFVHYSHFSTFFPSEFSFTTNELELIYYHQKA